MADEQYKNAPAQSTLSSGISSGDTTATVADGSVFSSTGDYRVIIDSELIIVTARSGNTLTIERGAEGSTAASHSSGATVTQIITRDAMLRLGSRLHPVTAYGSLPAAAESNRGWVNYPTDVPKLLRSDGSSWNGYGPVFPMKRPPDPAGMTWVNQGAASAVLNRETVYVEIPAVSGDNWRILVKSVPSAPYTVTMGFTPLWGGDNFARASLLIRNSSSGKFTVVGWDTNNVAPDAFVSCQNWTNATTFSGVVSGGTAYADKRSKIDAPFVFFRIRDDNTNLFFEYSPDYEKWHLIGTQGRTSFMTADQVGWGMEGFNGTHVNGMTIWSWLEE